MNRSLLLIAVFVCLCGLSCKEEIIISSIESLTDPSVQPRIIYTYPPMNSVGPYLEFNNEFPRIQIRFNKIMDRASFIQSIRVTSSMRSIFFNQYSITDNGGDIFFLTLLDSLFYRDALNSTLINEVFTVRLTEPIRDVNGNNMPEMVLGTITPETYFRIKEVYPPDGTLHSGEYDARISLSFNTIIDTSIFRYLSISPPQTGEWYFWYDSTKVYFSLQGVDAEQEYTISVQAEAHDKFGNHLLSPFSSSFSGPKLTVLHTYPRNEKLNLTSYIVFNWSASLDTGTIKNAITVYPEISWSIYYDRESSFFHTFGIKPLTQYRPSTKYTVTIDTTLRTRNGVRFDKPLAFEFITEDLRVAFTWPWQYESQTNWSRETTISLEFNTKVDTTTVKNSFSMDPPVEGVFSFDTTYYGGSNIIFDPDGLLAASTTYIVTIDSTLRSWAGTKLPKPYSFSFKTGS